MKAMPNCGATRNRYGPLDEIAGRERGERGEGDGLGRERWRWRSVRGLTLHRMEVHCRMIGKVAGVVMATILAGSGALLNGATLVQQNPGNLAFEAEAYHTLTGTGWTNISLSSGVKTLPAGSNVIGTAIYANGTGLSSFANYQMQFTSNGTYYVYARYSMYEITDTVSYGNEDSFFLPKALNQATSALGGEHVDWYANHVASNGHAPTVNANEGSKFYWKQGVDSAPSGTPVALVYTITGASEANPVTVTFSVAPRERGFVLDRFVFTTTPVTLTGGDSAVLNAIASVPEPSRIILLMAGVLGLMAVRRRK